MKHTATPPYTALMGMVRDMHIKEKKSFDAISLLIRRRNGKPVSRAYAHTVWSNSEQLRASFEKNPKDCIWSLSVRGRNIITGLRRDGILPQSPAKTVSQLRKLLAEYRIYPGAVRGYGVKTHREFIKLASKNP